jgi:hypothetical protein
MHIKGDKGFVGWFALALGIGDSLEVLIRDLCGTELWGVRICQESWDQKAVVVDLVDCFL